MRQLATVRRYARDTDVPVKSGRASFAYIAEKGSYGTTAPTYSKLSLKAYKVGGIIQVSEELLNDSVANIEAEVRDEIVYAEARLEESKFVGGSGSGEPTGWLGSATTGVTTAAAAKVSGDDVIDLFHALKPPYRKNATWLMNDTIAKLVRKVKADNATYGSLEYVWQPGLVAGNPDTILGRPVRYSQDMDTAVTVGKKVIAFGDFSFYRIADRTGLSIQRLNELYAGTGQVGFRCTMRNDGLLTMAEAIQLMVMHA
jgi:HK97 family phage major capsid protein